MAGILHNVFSKGIYTLKDPDNVSKIKTLVNHSALYFGLIVYTAIGAKVSFFRESFALFSGVFRKLWGYFGAETFCIPGVSIAEATDRAG